MGDYMRYINETLKSSSFLDNIKYREYNPVPFCIPHVYFVYKGNRTEFIHNKFNKFNKLPNKAHKLYWKLHPKERFWL
jgi:hypothetical protein